MLRWLRSTDLSTVLALREESLPASGASLFQQVCLFLLVALSPIQDFFLQGTPLKGIGASPSFIPLVALAGISFAKWLAGGPLKISRPAFVCICYAGVMTVYGFLVFGMTSHGENLIVKSLTNLITLALFLVAVIVPEYELRRTVRAACYCAFFLTVFGLCFSLAAPFGLPQFLEDSPLHFVFDEDPSRPRGLSTEPSTLSITVIAIGLLSAHFSRTRAGKLFFIVATVGLLLISQSKGGLAVLFICVFVLALMKWHRWYQTPVLVGALLPIAFLGFSWLSSLFPQGLAGLANVETRVSMILCSLYTVEHHPLGVGFSGFLPAVAAYLPPAMDTLQFYSPLPLNFGEVNEYLISSQDVGTKTFFFDQLMRFGLPFAILFVLAIRQVLRVLNAMGKRILFIAALAGAIALFAYVPLSGQYTTSILFGVALMEIRLGYRAPQIP